MVLVVDADGAFRREIGRSVRADGRDEAELAAVNDRFHVGGQHEGLLMCSSRLTFIPRVYEAELIAMLAARGRACGGAISSAVEQAPLQRRARSDAACVSIPAPPPLFRRSWSTGSR